MTKVRDLEVVGDLVRDGDTVALGGAWFSNHPMASVRQLIRAGRSDLHIIELLGSIDTDLLIGAGAVAELTFSMVTLEAFGLAPRFRRSVEAGELRLNELPALTMNIAIDAAGRNVPFLPLNAPHSDLLTDGEYVRTVTCPYTGAPTQVVRAIKPRVALIHALRADARGTTQVDGPHAIDPELARAAEIVIVTCEELVDTDEIVKNPALTSIPAYLVDVVIEAPFGAHPTTHTPRYGLDAWEIKRYAQAATDGEAYEGYLEQLRTESEAEYRARTIGERGRVLRALVDEAEVLEMEES